MFTPPLSVVSRPAMSAIAPVCIPACRLFSSDQANATSRSLFELGREAAFIDLDFDLTSRPELITNLLAITEPSAACSPSASVSLWQLSVATRLKRLLHVVRDTLALGALPVRLHCAAPRCGQWLEFDLPLADLDELHDESSDGNLLLFQGGRYGPLTFRRPTGEDLQRWRGTPVSITSVVSDLLVPESATSVSSAELPPAEDLFAAFAEFDALIAFEFTSTCPHCGQTQDHGVDLEQTALQRLHTLQLCLYRENHRLALAYGWSEAEILQMPRRRRLRYLAQMEESA